MIQVPPPAVRPRTWEITYTSFVKRCQQVEYIGCFRTFEITMTHESTHCCTRQDDAHSYRLLTSTNAASGEKFLRVS